MRFLRKLRRIHFAAVAGAGPRGGTVMKNWGTTGAVALLLFGFACTLARAEVASTERAISGLSSNKDRGSVTIALDPVLDKGRLVLNVTGYNRTDQPVSLTDGDIKVFTAAGRQVGLIKLDRLIAEARGGTSRRSPADRDPFDDERMGVPGRDPSDPLDNRPRDYRRPSTDTDTENTVGGATTRQSPTGDNSSVTLGTGSLGKRADVEALKGAILQAEVVQPSGAGGGKVVIEKLRFGRKDEHALRVQVNFAGEQHEFNFVPPES
jgi:hypothetical protein